MKRSLTYFLLSCNRRSHSLFSSDHHPIEVQETYRNECFGKMLRFCTALLYVQIRVRDILSLSVLDFDANVPDSTRKSSSLVLVTGPVVRSTSCPLTFQTPCDYLFVSTMVKHSNFINKYSDVCLDSWTGNVVSRRRCRGFRQTRNSLYTYEMEILYGLAQILLP